MRPENNGGVMWLGGVRNVVHSAALIGAMVALLAAVGGLFGGPLMVAVLLGLGLPLLVLGPSVGSRMALRVQGAVPLSAYAAPGLVEMATRLARRAALPAVPQLYLVPNPAVTAYTTGSRNSAAIALTDGLLRALNPRELAGVLAHELSHVRRNDVWVMGLANVIGRATNFMSIMGQILLFLNLPLLFMGRLTMPWTAIALLILAPSVSVLLQLALSRTREYQADRGAVQLTGDARGLASALAKLERLNAGFWERLMPGRRHDSGSSLFQTHPSTRDRIDRLLRLGRDGGGGRSVA
jgi:heat shock protein HtpX